MKKNKQLTIALSAFALTSLILLIVFYVSGVYPFGDRSLLKWDMELQYADFFRWWHRVLHGQASMFYSFSKSLGDNTFGLTAYYLSSPFNLLLYFTDDIPFFYHTCHIIKNGISSSDMLHIPFLLSILTCIRMEPDSFCFLRAYGI